MTPETAAGVFCAAVAIASIIGAVWHINAAGNATGPYSFAQSKLSAILCIVAGLAALIAWATGVLVPVAAAFGGLR